MQRVNFINPETNQRCVGIKLGVTAKGKIRVKWLYDKIFEVDEVSEV